MEVGFKPTQVALWSQLPTSAQLPHVFIQYHFPEILWMYAYLHLCEFFAGKKKNMAIFGLWNYERFFFCFSFIYLNFKNYPRIILLLLFRLHFTVVWVIEVIPFIICICEKFYAVLYCCVSLSSSALRDIILAAWNQSQWQYLCHRNQQMLQARAWIIVLMFFLI